ncbi:MAG: WYL domain-containing transcriptional regulator [Syntrophobacter sp.]
MAGFPQVERFYWFDDRLKQSRFPNAFHLAEQFEISHKTAQRDIRNLRDRMGAPIAYDRSRKGYYYTEQFELSRLPATQEEVLALLIARRLLSSTAGGFVGRAFQEFGRKLHETAAALGIDNARMEEAFSSSWHGHSPAQDHVFRNIVAALVECRMAEIDYHSPDSDANTVRIIEPHHLQHYMGSWVLVAYCRLRADWRKFYLSRIDGLKTLSGTFDPRPPEQWTHLLDEAFGIFQGGASILVTLRFSPFRTRWVREQIWHPAQEIRPTPDGGITLSFPVTDFREVRMMILQFGADVEVLAPEALRDEIGREVARMAGMYGPGESPRML